MTYIGDVRVRAPRVYSEHELRNRVSAIGLIIAAAILAADSQIIFVPFEWLATVIETAIAGTMIAVAGLYWNRSS